MRKHVAQRGSIALVIGAIGVVFGDIGTSPLYALRESFSPVNGLSINHENVLGIVSLLIWSITLIVCVKYLCFVLRADNKGEGGVLALVALLSRYSSGMNKRRIAFISLLGIIGAALIYSDGMLTPAVSVLSAIEGLSIIDHRFSAWVVPIALVVLVSLFPFQKRGTEKIGLVFGPILSCWFIVIGFLGFLAILKAPAILAALNPAHAVSFLLENRGKSLSVMGSLFLAMTGAEVLYSDLGHFGLPAIRKSWFFLVYPALLLTYTGQGAFLLTHPDQSENLFYRLAPSWAIIPMVILATVATIIASQAVITGSFSLARQAVQLGFWPRIQIKHTSNEKVGQVYVPLVNWVLMVGTVLLVVLFKTSGRLSHAYGIAVSATMFITTCLMISLAWRSKKVPLWVVIPLGLFFLVFEGAFIVANATKLISGGWIVVVLALGIIILMKSWVDGRALFRKRVQALNIGTAEFARMIAEDPPVRVKGTAFFLTANPDGIPKALLHNLKHNKVLHERTVILSVQTLDEPYVEKSKRIQVGEYEGGISHITLLFGFSETPDVPQALEDLNLSGYDHNPMKTTWFLGREAVAIGPKRGELSFWRKRLYIYLFHNAVSPADFFHLPADRVVEIGAKTEL